MKKYYPYLYFFICCCVLFILYYPAREGSFVLDFICFAYRYDHFNWYDIFQCKSDHSYHLFYHIVFYAAYLLFHTHANRWLLLFSALNAGVITLSFVVFKKLLEQANILYATGIAFCGSLLVLFSPYLDETVIWAPTLHYPLAVITIIISWWFIVKYIETNTSKYLWLAHLAFFASIYSLEIGVMVPFIIAAYLWFWPKPMSISKQQKLLILLPQFIIIFSYFAMNKVVFGDWVGHYGASVHLYLPPAFLASQLGCYLLKYVGLIHFTQFSTRDAFYSFAEKPVVGYTLLLCLYIIPLVLFIINYKKNSVGFKVGLLIYAFACFALLPTQNLYFTYLFRSENDRHGYFFSVFFYLLMAYVLIKSFKWGGYIIVLLYVVTGIYFSSAVIKDWQKGGTIVRALTKEYRWQNTNGKVHILMLGDNINGAYLFRSNSDSALFGEYYEVMNRKECTPVQEYMCMTMYSESDSVKTSIVNDSTLKVELLTGNWLMYNLVGANDYDAGDAYVKVNDSKTSYQITFKKKHRGDVYIYQSGSHWKQVDGF